MNKILLQKPTLPRHCPLHRNYVSGGTLDTVTLGIPKFFLERRCWERDPPVSGIRTVAVVLSQTQSTRLGSPVSLQRRRMVGS